MRSQSVGGSGGADGWRAFVAGRWHALLPLAVALAGDQRAGESLLAEGFARARRSWPVPRELSDPEDAVRAHVLRRHAPPLPHRSVAIDVGRLSPGAAGADPEGRGDADPADPPDPADPADPAGDAARHARVRRTVAALPGHARAALLLCIGGGTEAEHAANNF